MLILSLNDIITLTTIDDTETTAFSYDVSLNPYFATDVENWQKWTVEVIGYDVASGASLARRYEFTVAWYDTAFHFVGTGNVTPVFEERKSPDTDDWAVTITNDDELIQIKVIGEDTSTTNWTVTYKVLINSDATF
jgi:hypothetical protein